MLSGNALSACRIAVARPAPRNSAQLPGAPLPMSNARTLTMPTSCTMKRPPEMILDTSALAAVFFGEPELELYVQVIHDAARCRISAANFVELSMVVEGQIGPEAGRQCDVFFRRAEIVIEPVTVEQAHLARQAFLDRKS